MFKKSLFVTGLMVLLLAFSLGAQTEAAAPGVVVSLVNQEGPSADRNLVVEAAFTLPARLHQTLQEKYFGLSLTEESLPKGGIPGKVQYPKSDKFMGGIPSYEGSVRIRLPLILDTPPTTPLVLRGKVFWQLCYDDGVCLIPVTKSFQLNLLLENGRLVAPEAVVNLLQQETNLSPFSPSAINFPIATGGSPVLIPVSSDPAPSLGTLLLILFFAFLGGAILNLMPCVLPVLSLKALSLIKNSAQIPSARWAHAWAAAAGTLSSLWILALALIGLQSAGVSVGWGVQFQNPWYLIALLGLVLVFALSLFDIFVIPSLVVMKGKTPGLPGSFLSGLLTVVLATPCSAPFLGTALGLAFSSPWWVILLVFTFIGLGLALPFFLLTVIPGALKFLPRPGKWMETFRGFMAFGLVATGLWLLTILNTQLGPRGFNQVLWFLGALLLAAWIFGIIQRGALEGWRRKFAYGILGLCLTFAGAFFLNFPSKPPEPSSRIQSDLPSGWKPFSEEAVEKVLSSGAPVFVDFTADWCLTCKVNEAGALADPQVLNAFNLAGVTLFRGDYTNPDPVISSWLRKYKRAGIPFYALLNPGKEALLLPEFLTSEILLEAISSQATRQE